VAPGGGSWHPKPVGHWWQRWWRELDRAAVMVEGVKPGGGVGGGIRTGQWPAALGQVRLGRLCEAGDGVWVRQRHAGPQWMACRAVTPDGA
jgi:hypothetical protein